MALLAFFGPRVLGVFWWLFRPVYFNAAFSSFLWAIVAFVFAPWTAIGYLAVYPGGIMGWEWLLIGLGVVADIAAYGSSGYSYTQKK